MIDTNALRKKVLDLAIRGKLVPQNPNDEPASILLERIRAEKQRLIKEGKIKKDKVDSFIYKGEDNCHYEKVGNNEPILLEDLPFEIPNGWAWARLPSIAEVSAGGTPNRGVKKYWENGTIPWLKISDITSADKYVNNAEEYITEEGLNNSSAQYYEKGTILYTIFATVGEVGILDFKATCNQAIAGIKCFDSGFLDYLYYYLKNLKDFMLSQSKGNAQVNINQSKLKAALIAVPPLAEQERIVQFINEIFDVINQLDNNQDDYANLIETLKKAILQSAIQGKLVEQDENDEPASALLERIRAEKKALLGKKYVESYIYKGSDNRYYEHIGEKNIDITEKIPFDLPLGWCWEKISNVTLFQEGPGILAVDFRDKGIPLIRIAGMKGSFVSLEGCNYLDEAMVSKKWHHFRLDKGDIVISTSASMDKIAEVNEDTVGAIPYTGLIRFKMTSCLLSSYFKYFIRSPFYMRQIDEQKSGALISHYGPSHLNKMIIPIPPLAEQARIVCKINEIFAQL